MSWMTLDLRGGKASYRPGEGVRGTLRWELDSPPSRVEVRLFWYTRGKGTQDVEIVQTAGWDFPSAAESREFELRLPGAPFSFSGKLISLLWAVEAVSEPPGEVARAELTVSPTGAEILLEALPEVQAKAPSGFRPSGGLEA
jgi:hypothetical protein